MVALHTRAFVAVLLCVGFVSGIAVPSEKVGDTSPCDACMSMSAKFKDAIFNTIRLRDRAVAVYEPSCCDFFTSSSHNTKCKSVVESLIDGDITSMNKVYPSDEDICQFAGYCPVNGEGDFVPVPSSTPSQICDGVQQAYNSYLIIPDFNTNLRMLVCLKVTSKVQPSGKCDDYLTAHCQDSDTFDQGIWTDVRNALNCA